MKNSLIAIFAFLFTFAFSQETEIIKLSKSLKDKKGFTKSLTIIDQRNNSEIGSITRKDKKIIFSTPTNNIKQDLEKKFIEDNNKITGQNEIVIILKELTASNSNTLDYEAKVRVDMASFYKRNGNYFFINRIIGTTGNLPRLPNAISDNISNTLIGFITNSYNQPAVPAPISEENLNNYENIVAKTFPSYSSDQLKPGVYLTYKDFLSQKPTPATYRKNKDGEIKGVTNGTYDITINEIYCIVEDNKIYKAIPIGYREVFKDDQGFFINSAPKDLFIQGTSGAMIGGMTGGMVGALIGAAIDSGPKNNAYLSKEKTKIYIDKLTGGYIIEQ